MRQNIPRSCDQPAVIFCSNQTEALVDFGLHIVGKFSHQVKIPISTTFAAGLTVAVYLFLSVPNVLPTTSNFPIFLHEEIFKMDIQVSPNFKKIGINFPIWQLCVGTVPGLFSQRPYINPFLSTVF